MNDKKNKYVALEIVFSRVHCTKYTDIWGIIIELNLSANFWNNLAGKNYRRRGHTEQNKCCTMGLKEATNSKFTL